MHETTAAAVSPHPRPSGPVVMRQGWERLLFLHWQMEPADIQSTLPPGLSVDVWDGAAWVGIVPFYMRRVRPRFAPTVPGLSDFLELNVRTYVRDRDGRPGVWFYSLDCNQPAAVRIARAFFKLPYFDARMKAQIAPDSGRVYYTSRRAGTDRTSTYEYRCVGDPARARVGSLEEFLVERYRLFSARGAILYAGEVWHEPYKISDAEVGAWCAEPIRLANFPLPTTPPAHTIYAPGVDVSVFPLRRV